MNLTFITNLTKRDKTVLKPLFKPDLRFELVCTQFQKFQIQLDQDYIFEKTRVNFY